jgi:hypothetical protein
MHKPRVAGRYGERLASDVEEFWPRQARQQVPGDLSLSCWASTLTIILRVRPAGPNWPGLWQGHARQPGGALQRLAAEVRQDRAALLPIMTALGVPVRSYKVWAAWTGEKAARLKLNGRLLARSPLSSLEELEMMRLGVEGKAAGWRTLRALAETDTRLDPGRLDELISRARRQADLLEELRVRVGWERAAHAMLGRQTAG